MERPNPFYRRSRISAKKFRQLLRLFALDLTATDAAQLTGLTRKTVTTIFLKIRERLAEECERDSPLSSGEVEVDESYFGARRVRGKRGRGASGKTIVFGLLKRDGRVYTEIVPDCKKTTLQGVRVKCCGKRFSASLSLASLQLTLPRRAGSSKCLAS
jgi:hypothetical protein